MRIKKITVAAILKTSLLLLLTNTALAQSSNLEWDGFIDGYYAYDFN
jgi:hypothetical protein